MLSDLGGFLGPKLYVQVSKACMEDSLIRKRDSHSWFRHFVPTDLSDIRRTCYGDHEHLPCPLWEVLCCKWKTCSKVKRPPAELTMTDRASSLGLCQSSSVDVYGKHTKRIPAVGNAQHGMQGCRRALSGSALILPLSVWDNAPRSTQLP